MINLPYISKLFNKTKSLSNPNTASLYPNTKWKKILLGFFLCALTFSFLYFSAPTILSFLLVHKTPLKSADVILVSGTGQSLDTAIRLYREGIVKRFLITETIPDRYRGLDKPISVHYFIHRQLAEAGIPENKIACFKKTIHDPVQEQLRLRRWIMKNHIRSYMC
ncbi:hypothetical protein GF373_08355, partial [bacterium]|nr:hypothetical protein [bacterium]